MLERTQRAEVRALRLTLLEQQLARFYVIVIMLGPLNYLLTSLGTVTIPANQAHCTEH